MDLYPYFKKIAFSFDPEWVHDKTINLAQKFPLLAELFLKENDFDLSCDFAGLKWSSPIGLAAGLDKNAAALNFFATLGFGALEVGTVTPLSQPGNPKPRLFRIPEDESLRNALGFNNQGCEILKKNIQAYTGNTPVGINLGKNKLTPNDKALQDYQKLLESLQEQGDYYVINISSPNTPGLRSLQDKNFLEEIFQVYHSLNISKPLFVKLDPDSDEENQKSLVEVLMQNKVAGIIATNTTNQHQWDKGGVSGKRLFERAKMVRSRILEWTKKSDLSVIGVGGFSHPDQVLDFLKEGGKAVQVYTSLIYQGPSLPSLWNKAIAKRVSSSGASSLREWLAR